jgi:hypothetical protein
MSDISLEHQGDAFVALRDGEEVGALRYRRRGDVVDAYTTLRGVVAAS